MGDDRTDAGAAGTGGGAGDLAYRTFSGAYHDPDDESRQAGRGWKQHLFTPVNGWRSGRHVDGKNHCRDNARKAARNPAGKLAIGLECQEKRQIDCNRRRQSKREQSNNGDDQRGERQKRILISEYRSKNGSADCCRNRGS